MLRRFFFRFICIEEFFSLSIIGRSFFSLYTKRFSFTPYSLNLYVHKNLFIALYAWKKLYFRSLILEGDFLLMPMHRTCLIFALYFIRFFYSLLRRFFPVYIFEAFSFSMVLKPCNHRTIWLNNLTRSFFAHYVYKNISFRSFCLESLFSLNVLGRFSFALYA